MFEDPDRDPAPDPARVPPSQVGLCWDCQWVRIVRNQAGSEFFLCERAKEDPAFEKYPRLPVLECRGHEAKG